MSPKSVLDMEESWVRKAGRFKKGLEEIAKGLEINGGVPNKHKDLFGLVVDDEETE